MSNNDITNKALDYCCAMCGSEIVKLWDEENNQYRWACSKDNTHNGFQKKLSPQKALARGEVDKLLGKGAQKDLEELAKRSWTALSLLPKEDIATKRALGLVEIQALVTFAEQVGLNAYLGHVCLYYGKPYVTIDGYYYLNNKREQPFRIGVRPMVKEEKQAYMIEDATYAYIAQGWLGEKHLPDTGCGYITATEKDAMSERHPDQFRAPVVHNKPELLAEKRAKWQLLRQLIPLEVKE